MEQWHESKWKVMIPEDRRTELERFLGNHKLKVIRWVNCVPDVEGDPNHAKTIPLAEAWLRGDTVSARAQAIAEGSITPKQSTKDTIQEAPAPVQEPKKATKKRRKKGGE